MPLTSHLDAVTEAATAAITWGFPVEKVALIIGRAGANIHWLRAETGASVETGARPPADQRVQHVTFSGTKTQVVAAGELHLLGVGQVAKVPLPSKQAASPFFCRWQRLPSHQSRPPPPFSAGGKGFPPI
jgi:hypothetical protein